MIRGDHQPKNFGVITGGGIELISYAQRRLFAVHFSCRSKTQMTNSVGPMAKPWWTQVMASAVLDGVPLECLLADETFQRVYYNDGNTVSSDFS